MQLRIENKLILNNLGLMNEFAPPPSGGWWTPYTEEEKKKIIKQNQIADEIREKTLKIEEKEKERLDESIDPEIDEAYK